MPANPPPRRHPWRHRPSSRPRRLPPRLHLPRPIRRLNLQRNRPPLHPKRHHPQRVSTIPNTAAAYERGGDNGGSAGDYCAVYVHGWEWGWEGEGKDCIPPSMPSIRETLSTTITGPMRRYERDESSQECRRVDYAAPFWEHICVGVCECVNTCVPLCHSLRSCPSNTRFGRALP